MNPEAEPEISFGVLARKHLSSQTPFCLIRFPGEQEAEFYHLPEKSPANENRHLAIADWDPAKAGYFYSSLPADLQDLPKKGFKASSPHTPEQTTFAEYQSHFEKYQSAFANSSLKKAILSRVKNVAIPERFGALEFFEKLEKTYPDALVYILLHPTAGLWIGATPEVLLQHSKQQYKTMSLAGTRARSAKPYQWTEKEIEEQELVSEHIREQLLASKAQDLQESIVRTVEAGSVAHLCSDFQFSTNNAPSDYREIIARLHPTPAIAGLPVKSAIEIIDKTEVHKRRLYSGTLGRKKEDSIDYYVNLRCMQVFPGSISLYLGGGITAGSELKSEWEETEKKAKTLLDLMDYGK